MRYTARSMIPLTLTGCAVIAVITACDQTSSYSSGAGQPVIQMPGDTEAAPALYAVRAFDLGQIVVDGQGFTLYRYEKDSANPSRSACDSACAQQWKPVSASARSKVEGIDPALVGSLTRTDGTDQVTLAGWPLYRYAKDEMPGETAGQGVGGAWFPTTPTGEKVQVVANPGQSDAFGL